jgi:hypothetical protein
MLGTTESGARSRDAVRTGLASATRPGPRVGNDTGAERPATGERETFVGKIRWVALAIGLACLAMLTLVAGTARAAPVAPAGIVAYAGTPAGTHSLRALAAWSPAMRTERRKPSDR